MTKNMQIAERILITFVEAAAAYLIVIPTVNWSKTVLAGAAGAGLSAVYNIIRQANPTITAPTAVYDPALHVTPEQRAGAIYEPSATQSENDILDDLANEPEETPPVTRPTV